MFDFGPGRPTGPFVASGRCSDAPRPRHDPDADDEDVVGGQIIR
jgi:hypothetical protein